MSYHYLASPIRGNTFAPLQQEPTQYPAIHTNGTDSETHLSMAFSTLSKASPTERPCTDYLRSSARSYLTKGPPHVLPANQTVHVQCHSEYDRRGLITPAYPVPTNRNLPSSMANPQLPTQNFSIPQHTSRLRTDRRIQGSRFRNISLQSVVSPTDEMILN